MLKTSFLFSGLAMSQEMVSTLEPRGWNRVNNTKAQAVVAESIYPIVVGVVMYMGFSPLLPSRTDHGANNDNRLSFLVDKVHVGNSESSWSVFSHAKRIFLMQSGVDSIYHTGSVTFTDDSGASCDITYGTLLFVIYRPISESTA